MPEWAGAGAGWIHITQWLVVSRWQPWPHEVHDRQKRQGKHQVNSPEASRLADKQVRRHGGAWPHSTHPQRPEPTVYSSKPAPVFDANKMLGRFDYQYGVF